MVCKCIGHAKCGVSNMLQIFLLVQCKLYFREATKAKRLIRVTDIFLLINGFALVWGGLARSGSH